MQIRRTILFYIFLLLFLGSSKAQNRIHKEQPKFEKTYFRESIKPIWAYTYKGILNRKRVGDSDCYNYFNIKARIYHKIAPRKFVLGAPPPGWSIYIYDEIIDSQQGNIKYHIKHHGNFKDANQIRAIWGSSYDEIAASYEDKSRTASINFCVCESSIRTRGNYLGLDYRILTYTIEPLR